MEHKKIWRWDADITWHYHASMVYANYLSKNLKSKFEKYYYARSCIFFAIGALEAELNNEMRKHLLQSDPSSDEDIIKAQRKTSFSDKVKKWPRKLYGRGNNFRDDVMEAIRRVQEVRNEVTHPKREDHSIFADLDGLNLDVVVDKFSVALVQISEWNGVPFNYWVTGWNYVSGSGKLTEVILCNNGNSFVYSLSAMGFRDTRCNGVRIGDWENVLMTSIDDYEILKKALSECPLDIEKYCPSTPAKPRLCRRWWDEALILNSRAE